jgi:hypothetical protein
MAQQPRLAFSDIAAIITQVKFKDYVLHLTEIPLRGILLQVRYMEPDIDMPGGPPIPQHGRKWFISPFSTETEIVRTAYKALLTSLEHQLGEHFTYVGDRVYSPHLSISARRAACRANDYDTRIPPEEKGKP